MSRRDYIGLKTKLAATLCQMLRADEDGKFVPVISYEDAKRLSEDEIISRFNFDHYPIRKAQGGPDEHWNLVPRPTAEHKDKTAKIDIPEIAKSKRLAINYEENRRVMLAKAGQGARPEKKRSRLQSRNSFKR